MNFNRMRITIVGVQRLIADLIVMRVGGKIIYDNHDTHDCVIQLNCHRIRTTVSHLTIINNKTKKSIMLNYSEFSFVEIYDGLPEDKDEQSNDIRN